MNERPTPIGTMLKELEERFYVVTRIIGGRTRISCRHCNLEIEYDEADHEQAAHGAAAYLAHLKKNHAKLLSKPMQIELDKL